MREAFEVRTVDKVRKFYPGRGRVLIRAANRPSTTPGGIAIPGTAKEVPNEGVVVAVGGPTIEETVNGRVLLEFEAKVGDRVLLSKYVGQVVTVGGEQMRIVDVQDVLAVVRTEGTVHCESD